MGILNALSKAGILRYGAKAGTYKNAAERPTEFMMDDVYNAERDLVAGGKPKAKDEAGAATKPDGKAKS